MSARILPNSPLIHLFEAGEPRAPGYHVSGSLQRVLKAINKSTYAKSVDAPTNYWAVGHAIEHAFKLKMAEVYPERYADLGQLTVDGITGSPDLIDLEPDDPCVLCDEHCSSIIDVKLTKYSSRKLDEMDSGWDWKYWAQVKAYAHMVGFHRGQILAIFINGNYRGGVECDVALMDQSFEAQELEENWAMIVNNKGEPE